jgi:SAM-dependent methyltransferase
VELLIGCGSRRDKRLAVPGKEAWTELVTLDHNADHKPDVVWDLNVRPLPFADSTFDEVHAYDVLEHLGRQGDWRSFFDEWSEWWRILKPGGAIHAISPAWNSQWAWGDPSHTRVYSLATITFLTQPEYTKQVGVTPMSDFRFCYKADFDILHANINGETFEYVLQAVKPSRLEG